MLANADLSQEFTVLGQQYKKLVEALVDAVNIPPTPLEAAATRQGNFRGFDAGRLYVVRRGSLTARHRGRPVYVLEAGDILLPDITGTADEDAAVYYGSEAGAELDSYPALEFIRRVFEDPNAIRIWTRLLITYAGLMVRITAALSSAATGSSFTAATFTVTVAVSVPP